MSKRKRTVKCKTKTCDVRFEHKVLPMGTEKKFCSLACRIMNEMFSHPKKAMLSTCKSRALKKGWKFELTEKDIPDMPERCPVFPWMKLERPTGRGIINLQNAVSVDRIKPELGYVPGNIELISVRANHLKSDATIKELEHVIAYLKKHGAK